MKTTDVKAYSNGKDTGIQVFVCKDYDALSAKAAAIVSGEINKKAHFILGLATGTSPIGLYTELANLNAEGKVDFSGVTTYNLDEYYPIAPENDQSYRYFMNKYLFNKVNIDMAETHLLNGKAEDPEAECRAYDELSKLQETLTFRSSESAATDTSVSTSQATNSSWVHIS
jgi:glucosamine-6-phosphate deaminase